MPTYLQLSIHCTLPISDESEPSWLEPELELKDFQLGSAHDLFFIQLEMKNQAKTSQNFDFVFLMKCFEEND